MTKNKTRLLLDAVAATNLLAEPIVEIGSYRGATTAQLANNTSRIIYAVDPFRGYGGWPADAEYFKQRCTGRKNVIHLRSTSGEAVRKFGTSQQLSFVIIDAVNDFVNVWFNFWAWERFVSPCGLIAINGVDDWAGPNFACRRLLKFRRLYEPWGYCPDLMIFCKSESA